MVVVIFAQMKKETSGPNVTCADCTGTPCDLYSKPSTTYGTTYCLDDDIGDCPSANGWTFDQSCTGGGCECTSNCDDYCIGDDLYACDGCNYIILNCGTGTPYCVEKYIDHMSCTAGTCVECVSNLDCDSGEECQDNWCVEVTPEPDSCSDTDGGKSIYQIGTTSGYLSGNSYSHTDFCTNDCTAFGTPSTTGTCLVEYWCQTSTTEGTHVDTCDGNGCSNGVCLQPQTCAQVGGQCLPNICSEYNNCIFDTGTCQTGTCCSGSCTEKTCSQKGGICCDAGQTCTGTTLTAADCNVCCTGFGACTAGCIPSWSCTAWTNSTGQCGTRTCTDSNDCGIGTGKPIESKVCGSSTGTDDWTKYLWIIGGFFAFLMIIKVMGKK